MRYKISVPERHVSTYYVDASSPEGAVAAYIRGEAYFEYTEFSNDLDEEQVEVVDEDGNRTSVDYD